MVRIKQDGVWRFVTHNATYELDFDNSLMTRSPRRSDDGTLRGGAMPLRLDDQPVPLLACDPVGLGEPLVMLLDIVGSGVITTRRTTPVRSAHRVAASNGARQRLWPGLTGAWRVMAKTSEHVWDMDELTYTRLPGETATRMDYDGVALPIIGVVDWPAVGQQSHVVCEHPDDAALELFRVSSRIQRIARVDPAGKES